LKITVFWDVAPCSLVEVYGWAMALMMEVGAESTSETPVNLYQTTQRNISENSLHTRHRENLKSHIFFLIVDISLCFLL
jgi:hypothetical protein